ncbi:uncharacterized protein G6M90_00g051450 [Metarhizium brunneum]|uniref:Uncharacterized protein n=1 Tax=Metarhizium brunneum TaxID=500148 RepID=A0A7D5UWX7_9HYPO|nr:hypothetical protein G6M90_00g051450 [Metarhizium brunneum]
MILTQISESKLSTRYIPTSQFQDSQIEPCSGLDKDAYFKSGVPYILARTGSPSQHIPTPVVQQSLDRDVSAALRRNEAKPGTASFTAFVPEQDAALIVWNMAEVSKRRQTKCHANSKDITNAHELQALFTPREMVYTFRTFAASDPRDKIFAFYRVLNLSSEVRWQAITIRRWRRCTRGQRGR